WKPAAPRTETRTKPSAAHRRDGLGVTRRLKSPHTPPHTGPGHPPMTVIQMDLFRPKAGDAFTVPAAVRDLIASGALFAVNNSGGKDSQAMLALLRKVVPAAQLLVIHAHLEGEEWQGVAEHVQGMSTGLEVIIATPVKTFTQMVEH